MRLHGRLLAAEIQRCQVPTANDEPMRPRRPAPLRPSQEEKRYQEATTRFQRLSMKLAHLYQRDVSVDDNAPSGGYWFNDRTGRITSRHGAPPKAFLLAGGYVSLSVTEQMAHYLLNRDGSKA